MHLSMHAQTFGTLTNTQVGIKEMVHRIFKGIVPRTNRKNIDLDLLRRYNTLFAIRHLVDGGIDPRFARSCAGFTSSNFGHLFSNWYLTEDKSSNEENEEDLDNCSKIKKHQFLSKFVSIKLFLTFFFNLVTSSEDFISGISLKKKMSKQGRDNLLSSLPNLKTELLASYKDIGFGAALLYFTQSISWYEFASYTIEELNGTFSNVSLHINDFITIDEEDYDKSYAIIRRFFKHKGNNEKYYAFMAIN